MKKQILLLTSLVALLFTGCASDNKVFFEIKNNSDVDLKQVTISASEETCASENYAETISKNSEKKLFLDFSYASGTECSHPTSDGEYIFTYKSGTEKIEKRFGYYTNGIPLDKKFRIEVRNNNEVFVNGLKNNFRRQNEEEDIQQTDQDFENNGRSSIKEISDCDLDKYKLDCNMVKFLEETVAWTTEPNGVDFCAYETLATQGNTYFLQVFCEEFYPQDEKFICPDEQTKEDCFLSKTPDQKECREECEVQKVSPYLVTSGGISVPLKLTTENGEFNLWMPRDGSFYPSDLKKNFPPDVYKKLKDTNTGSLKSINISRAENYFDINVSFEQTENLQKTCTNYTDCGILPPEYAIISSCPHEVKCLENQCVVGCYDFHDYTRFPQLKKYSWPEIEEIIKSGEVEEVFQAHNLDVKIHLKNGTEISVIEPKIDAIFDLIDECGELCEEIIKGTE